MEEQTGRDETAATATTSEALEVGVWPNKHMQRAGSPRMLL